MLTIHQRQTALLLSTVICLSGCSGLGQFSRQDYASLTADPFLESDSDFSSDYDDAAGSTSGFARLDDPRAPVAKSVATISDTRSSGPSLSDFLSDDSGGPPVSSASDSINTSRAQVADLTQPAHDEFLDWATDQKREIQQASAQWNNELGNRVQTADHQIRREVAAVQSSISRFPKAAARQAQAATDQFFADEPAEPLIQNRVRPAAAVATRIAEENPFAEFERQQGQLRSDDFMHPAEAMKTAAAPWNSRTRPTIPATPQSARDDSTTRQFAQDSGWRPANLEFP